MSRLEELIQELCPDGVEYKNISEICETITDYTAAGSFADVAKNVKYINNRVGYAQLIRTTDLKSKFENPEKFIYVDEHAFNYLWRVNLNVEGLVLPNVGNCGEVYYVTPEILPHTNNVLGPNAIWVRSSSVDNRFLFHVFSAAEFQKKLAKIISPTGQTKFNKTNFKALTIPVPPLEVQREIVRILDNFTELIEELKKELDIRKQLYDEYAYNLLIRSNHFDKIKLTEVCCVKKGNTAIQKSIPGEYPLVVTTSERKRSDSYQFDTTAVCIPLVSSRGHGVASLNHVYYQEGKFALGNILCAVIPIDTTVINAKYLYYYFECTKNYTLVPLMKGGANVAMHISDIEKVRVPLPPINEQLYIIEKLEAFEKYNSFLTKEIEARQKQYEFYREKFLGFKKYNQESWRIIEFSLPDEIKKFMNSVFDIHQVRGKVGICNGILFEVRSKETNHPVPHVHAKYSEYEISIDLNTAEVLAGNLPNKKQKIAVEWVKKNRKKLLNDWKTLSVSAVSTLTVSGLDMKF